MFKFNVRSEKFPYTAWTVSLSLGDPRLKMNNDGSSDGRDDKMCKQLFVSGFLVVNV